MTVHILSLFDDDDFLPEKPKTESNDSVKKKDESAAEDKKDEPVSVQREAERLISIELPEPIIEDENIEGGQKGNDDLDNLYKEAVILSGYTLYNDVEEQINTTEENNTIEESRKTVLQDIADSTEEGFVQEETEERFVGGIIEEENNPAFEIEKNTENPTPENETGQSSFSISSSIVFDTTATASQKEEVTEAPKVEDLPEWKLEKKYYGISEVANMFGVNVSHIRFWTNEFKLKIRTNKKGDRLYNPGNIDRLRLIHHLVKVQKHTIKGAKEKLKTKHAAVVEEISLKDSLESLKEQLLIIRNNL